MNQSQLNISAHLLPPNAMNFPEIGHADFNFAEFPSLIQQSSTDLNLTEKDSSDYGSCKNNFLSSSNSSDADSGTNRYDNVLSRIEFMSNLYQTYVKPERKLIFNFLFSPQHERKYSSDGEASPVVVKLEHLESLVDPSSVFSIENSNPYANYFPHFTPSQLNQVNIRPVNLAIFDRNGCKYEFQFTNHHLPQTQWNLYRLKCSRFDFILQSLNFYWNLGIVNLIYNYNTILYISTHHIISFNCI